MQSFQVIHICGQGNTDPTIDKKGYIQFEYVNETLKDLLAITDFVVSRAGANAIFEFLALRIPMLLIPLSLQASRGDQIVNAESFKKRGYAHVLSEENLTTEKLLEEIFKLQARSPVLIDQMKKYQTQEARDRVVDIILKEQKRGKHS